MKSEAIWLESIPFSGMVEEERRTLRRQIRMHLTKRQKTVFDLLCQGCSNQEIGLELGLSSTYAGTLRHRVIQRAKHTIKKLNSLNGYDYRNNR